jgi:hypothetical protein
MHLQIQCQVVLLLKTAWWSERVSCTRDLRDLRLFVDRFSRLSLDNSAWPPGPLVRYHTQAATHCRYQSSTPTLMQSQHSTTTVHWELRTRFQRQGECLYGCQRGFCGPLGHLNRCFVFSSICGSSMIQPGMNTVGYYTRTDDCDPVWYNPVWTQWTYCPHTDECEHQAGMPSWTARGGNREDSHPHGNACEVSM